MQAPLFFPSAFCVKRLSCQVSSASDLLFFLFTHLASLTHQGIMAIGMESGGQPVIPELLGGPQGVLDPGTPIAVAPSSIALAPTTSGASGGTDGRQGQFVGVKRKDLANIVTFADVLKLCGFVDGQEDLVVQGIFTALVADCDLSYSVWLLFGKKSLRQQ